jgi:hypothetical protein
LSAAVIGDHVFIVNKMTLGTSIDMVRVGDENHPSAWIASKYLLTDDDVHGPIVVSAKFNIGPTLAESSLTLNYDQKAELRREIRLIDCFKKQAK